MTIKSNKNRKILISIILFLLLAIIGNTVNGATPEIVEYAVRWNPIGDNLGRITVAGNTSWFCGKKHGELRNKTYTFIENDDFEINKDNYMDFQYIAYIFSFFEEDARHYASYYEEISNIFGEQQKSMNSLDDEQYKALQQILWESKNYRDKELFNNGDNYTDLTQKAAEWKAEALKYQEYIEALKNQYSVTVNGEEKEDPVVNRENGTITFGKFSIDYLYQCIEESVIDASVTGEKGRRIMFSGIEDIIVFDPSTEKEIENVKLIREDGTIIGSEEEYPYPKSNEKFYVEVPYSDELSNINIKVKFKYIDNMESIFRRYTLNNTKIEYHDEDDCNRDDKGKGCCWDWAKSISQDLLKYNITHVTWKTDEVVIEDLTKPDPSKWTFEIDKIDLETKERLNDAYFTVKIEQSENNTNWTLVKDEVEYQTRNGKITIEDLTCYGYVKFTITETKAPEEYEKLNNPIVIILYKEEGIDGNITWYEVNGEERKLYDESGNQIGDAKLENEDNKNLETIVNNSTGAQKFTITIPNKITPPDEELIPFVIKLYKVDEDGDPLSKAQFSFILYKVENGNRNTIINLNYKNNDYKNILTTNSNGVILLNKDKVEKLGELLDDGDYELVVKEDKVPSGYKKTYYQARIPFNMKDGKIDEIHTNDITVKTSSSITKEKEYNYTNSGPIIVEKYKDDEGLVITVENTSDDVGGGGGGGSRTEGYDIILNKVLLDNTDETTQTLQDIKFDIVMKKGNTVLKTWKNKETTSKGKITLSNIKEAGDITLEITEKLTDKQKEMYGIIGNPTKIVSFTAISEKKISVRRYYIVKDSWKIENEDSGIEIKEPKGTGNIDELTLTIKNKGEDSIPIGINVAGTVFVDSLTGKSGIIDGIFDVGDDVLENIEVTLVDYRTGNPVTRNRLGDTLLNPIRTDENGKYEFLNLNPMEQYKVKFTYNGQDYEDTEYFAPENSSTPSYAYCTDETNVLNKEAWAYNTKDWAKLSKALESIDDRTAVNARFAEIGDYPESYISTNSLGYGLTTNAAYSKNAIAGMYDKIAEGNIPSPSELSNEEKMMLQYIEDCKVSAYTDAYPAFNVFSISDENGKVLTINQENGTYTEEDAIALYEGQNEINFGLKLRPEVDLRISDTVEKVDVQINKKQETYTYTEIEDAVVYLRTFDIQRNTDAGYGNGIAYYDNEDDLQIYVTHKIRITNESETVATVRDFIEYYDSNYYTFVEAYDNGGNKINNIGDSEASGNYLAKKISVPTINLSNGDEQYVYVKLQLNAIGENASETLKTYLSTLEGIIQPGSSVENMNYVEISGYSTGENVGLVDRDSIAGNFSPEAYEDEDKMDEEGKNYNSLTYYVEDDTSGVITTFKTLSEDDPETPDNEDYNSRTLSGNVFEDKRVNLSTENETIDTNPIYADSNISKIKGITVELLEILRDDTGEKYIFRAKTETDENGNYKFEDYIPGDYVIRFTYGDKTHEVDGNETIYNGQHYQSTYANPNTNETKYWYTDGTKYSDAYDKVQDREDVIEYANESLVSDEEGSGLSMNYYKTDLLKNITLEAYKKYYNQENSLTDIEKAMIEANKMQAYTSKLELEVESMINNSSTTVIATQTPEYKVLDVDFGLVKRAESKMVLEQHLSHLTITKSDGSTLVDTPVKIENNLLGQPEIILEDGSDKVHFQYVGTPNSYGVGTAKLEIDNEILIGNIDLEYTITVKNSSPNTTTLTYYRDGNADTVAVGYYEEPKEELVYWEDNGIRYYNEYNTEIKINIIRNEPQEITTKAENIINYVSTNLNYDSFKNGEDNSVWELITNADATLSGNVDNTKAVSNDGYKQYNQLLLAKEGNGLIGIELTPGNEVRESLTLSATNVQEVDLNYYNIAEILEIENSAGRVDEYSTPGNLNPVIDYTDYSKYSVNVIDNDRCWVDNVGTGFWSTTDNGDGLADEIKDKADVSSSDRKYVIAVGKTESGVDIIQRRVYEPDSSQAEHLLITDTTGNTHYYYLLIGTVLVIFTAGIVLIKKYVVDKNV